MAMTMPIIAHGVGVWAIDWMVNWFILFAIVISWRMKSSDRHAIHFAIAHILSGILGFFGFWRLTLCSLGIMGGLGYSDESLFELIGAPAAGPLILAGIIFIVQDRKRRMRH